MYLLDSDFIINYLRDREEAVSFLAKLPPESLFVSVISVGEILEGIYARKDRKSALQFQEFITKVEVLNVDYVVVERFAALRALLRQKGNLLENFDLLIASTCLSHSLTLVTKNIAHFNRIPRLKILDQSIVL